MKQIILCGLLCIVTNLLVSQESDIITDTLAFQLSLYTYGGDKIQKINEYRTSIYGGRTAENNEEDIFACENILLTEECNFAPPDSDSKRSLYLALRAQNEKCEVYMRDHEDSGIYFLTSFGDIKLRLLEFISSSEMIRESMKAKELYTRSLRIDKRSSYALTSYALWQYFAPPIAGGGYNAALGTFNKALNFSKTDRDKYFVYIYRSQLYFSMRRTNDSSNDLEAAHRLVPGEQFTAIVREANGNGKTLFD